MSIIEQTQMKHECLIFSESICNRETGVMFDPSRLKVIAIVFPNNTYSLIILWLTRSTENTFTSYLSKTLNSLFVKHNEESWESGSEKTDVKCK